MPSPRSTPRSSGTSSASSAARASATFARTASVVAAEFVPASARPPSIPIRVLIWSTAPVACSRTQANGSWPSSIAVATSSARAATSPIMPAASPMSSSPVRCAPCIWPSVKIAASSATVSAETSRPNGARATVGGGTMSWTMSSQHVAAAEVQLPLQAS